MEYSISKLAKLFELSTRALHYYDEIGLLKPAKVNKVGYRVYDDESIKKLSQIVFFKDLDIPLKEIKKIISNSEYDSEQALKNHQNFLNLKKQRLNQIINLIDDIIKGEIDIMDKNDNLIDINKEKEKYAKEAYEKWGDTKEYKENMEKEENRTDKEATKLEEEANKIFKEFSHHTNDDPSCEAVQSLVKEWHEYINNNHYKCSKEILLSLAEMYVEDERFKNNIDAFGDGTAQIMKDGIEFYCSK